MKSKAIIPMLVGVGIGLLAIKLGWNYIEQSRLSAEASQGDTPVVLAAQKLGPGRPLGLADFKVVQWPRSVVPAESSGDPEALVGRVNLTPLAAGVPILESMLAPPGTAPGLPSMIPTGYQGMAVKVDEFAGVGGFLKPDDKVDVVATFNVKRTKEGNTETVTRTILRDIRVLAVAQETTPNENNQPMVVRSVTLLVKPQQAQRLSLAATRGTITLSLRSGQGMDETGALSAITFEELLRNESSDAFGAGDSSKSWMEDFLTPKEEPKPEPVAIQVKVDPHWSMKIVKGSQAEDIVFENNRSSRRVDPSSLEQGGPGNVQELDADSEEKVSELMNEFFEQQEAGE